MSAQLQDQIAIITGAGRGFGRAIAMRLAQEGAAVTVTARTRAELDAVVAEIQSVGGRALAVQADVTSHEDVTRVVRQTREQWGDASLFVNNAGLPGPFGPLWEIDPATWWQSQAVHIYAPVLFLREILPSMMRRKSGRIVMVSAIASRTVAPYLSAYCLGKSAQTRLIEQLAAETRGHGVYAFAIDPGFAMTRLAEETMESADAQHWLPGMVNRLRTKRNDPDAELDMRRCAQRCVELASGRYDALSGKYMELTHDLEEMLRSLPEA